MKKLLAIVMSLAMLLSACAFAEAADVLNGGELTISDIVAYAGDDVLLDLTGLGASLGVYYDENAVGVQLGLNAMDQDALDLNLAFAGGQLLLGMTGVSKVYGLDVAALAEGAGLDMDAAADLDVNAVINEIDPVNQAAMLKLLTDALTTLNAGITTGLTEEIDGVTYDVTTIEVNENAIKPLMDDAIDILKIYSNYLEDVGLEGIFELYEQLDPAVSLNGSVCVSDEVAFLDLTARGSVLEGSHNGYMSLYAEGKKQAEDGSFDLYIEIGGGLDEYDYTLAFNLDFVAGNDGSWIPVSDAPVDLLSALEDEAQSQQLMLEAMSTGMMALSQMAAANQTVAGLLGIVMAG